MTATLWFRDVISFGLQAGMLIGAGALLAALFRLREPRVMLLYWQTLLAACVVLPLCQGHEPDHVRPAQAGGDSSDGHRREAGVRSGCDRPSRAVARAASRPDHEVIEESVRTLFWFHPGIWWLIGRIQLSRGQVVDQAAVRMIVWRAKPGRTHQHCIQTTAAARRCGVLAEWPSLAEGRGDLPQHHREYLRVE